MAQPEQRGTEEPTIEALVTDIVNTDAVATLALNQAISWTTIFLQAAGLMQDAANKLARAKTLIDREEALAVMRITGLRIDALTAIENARNSAVSSVNNARPSSSGEELDRRLVQTGNTASGGGKPHNKFEPTQ